MHEPEIIDLTMAVVAALNAVFFSTALSVLSVFPSLIGFQYF